MLAKEFNVFCLMANLPVPTVRYLASFLAPHKTKILVGLVEALPRRPGSYLLVDDRLNVWGPLLHRQPGTVARWPEHLHDL